MIDTSRALVRPYVACPSASSFLTLAPRSRQGHRIRRIERPQESRCIVIHEPDRVLARDKSNALQRPDRLPSTSDAKPMILVAIDDITERKRAEKVVVQKLPESSIEAICHPGRECSSVKSSTKVSLLAMGLSAVISEELAPSACPGGLDNRRRPFRLADGQSSASYFLRRFIAPPFIACLHERCSSGTKPCMLRREGRIVCYVKRTPTPANVPTALAFIVLSGS